MASRLNRLIGLDAYLRRNVFPNVSQLCETFEIQPRTLFQDIKELRERFGFDIRFDRHRNGYYNADPSKRLPALALSYDELVMVVVALHITRTICGASFDSLFASLLEGLGVFERSELGYGLGEKLQLDMNVPPVSADVFVRLIKACMGERRVRVVSSGNGNAATMLPRVVALDNLRWKLIGEADDAAVEIPVDLIQAVYELPALEDIASADQ